MLQPELIEYWPPREQVVACVKSDAESSSTAPNWTNKGASSSNHRGLDSNTCRVELGTTARASRRSQSGRRSNGFQARKDFGADLRSPRPEHSIKDPIPPRWRHGPGVDSMVGLEHFFERRIGALDEREHARIDINSETLLGSLPLRDRAAGSRAATSGLAGRRIARELVQPRRPRRRNLLHRIGALCIERSQPLGLRHLAVLPFIHLVFPRLCRLALRFAIFSGRAAFSGKLDSRRHLGELALQS
jgi:hypothetical protein